MQLNLFVIAVDVTSGLLIRKLTEGGTELEMTLQEFTESL